MSTNQNQQIPVKGLVTLFLLALSLLVGIPAIWGSFFTVDSGERGVVKKFGSIVRVEDEGLHMKWPFVETVIKADIRSKKFHVDADAVSKDKQKTHTGAALNYHLDPALLGKFFRQNRSIDEMQDKVIEPRIQDILKSVTAKYDADYLLGSREEVKAEIRSALKASISDYYLIVEDVQLTNFQFSKEYNDAIEAKQVASQKALTAKNDLDRIRVEAEQTIATAKADAEAIRIKSEAVRQQGGKEYVQLKAIEKWDGALPKYQGGSAPTPFLDVK